MNHTWTIVENDSPIIATAIHNGHEVRAEVLPWFAIDEQQRLREEDPYTGEWTLVADTRVVVHRSRFEVDMNRSRDKSIYLVPEDAWGLRVWENTPPFEILENSRALYDAFYFEIKALFDRVQSRWQHFIVLDLHSYNHHRGGPSAPPDTPEKNPEINVGTHDSNREFWAAVIERFMADMRGFDFKGRHLDVRENIKFRVGHMAKWLEKNYPKSCCVLSIEFKKFFMNEWTGEPYRDIMDTLGRALSSTIPGLREELKRFK